MVNYLWDNLFKKDHEEKLIFNLLQDCYLFEKLSLPELNFLQKVVHIRSYRPGEHIFRNLARFPHIIYHRRLKT